MANEAIRRPVEDARPRDDLGRSDGSLLREFRHGDQEAARLLYLRYAGRLRALARSRSSPDLALRVDADDFVQSVFGSFIRGVIHGSYEVPAGEELWNLFFVITVNKIRAKGAYFRARKRDMRRELGGDAVDALATDQVTAQWLELAVKEVLQKMPEHQSEVIRLRMEGYEVAEIAKITGRAKRSVERNLQDGRKRLDALLER